MIKARMMIRLGIGYFLSRKNAEVMRQDIMFFVSIVYQARYIAPQKYKPQAYFHTLQLKNSGFITGPNNEKYVVGALS